MCSKWDNLTTFVDKFTNLRAQNSCIFSALSRNFFSQPLRIFSQLLRIFSQLVRLRMYREFLRMYFLISPVVSAFSPDVLGVVGFSHIIEPIITGVGLWLYCLWKCIFPVLGQSKMDRPPQIFYNIQKGCFRPVVWSHGHRPKHWNGIQSSTLFIKWWPSSSASTELRQVPHNPKPKGYRIRPYVLRETKARILMWERSL